MEILEQAKLIFGVNIGEFWQDPDRRLSTKNKMSFWWKMKHSVLLSIFWLERERCLKTFVESFQILEKEKLDTIRDMVTLLKINICSNCNKAVQKQGISVLRLLQTEMSGSSQDMSNP